MTRRKRYSAEFKREALRRANEEGVRDYESSNCKLMAKFATEPRAYNESKTEFIQTRY